MKRRKILCAVIINLTAVVLLFSAVMFCFGVFPDRYLKVKRGELTENADTDIFWDGVCIKGEDDFPQEYLFLQENIDELNKEFGKELQMGDRVWIVYWESGKLMYPGVADPVYIL